MFENYRSEGVTIGDNPAQPVRRIETYSIQLRTGVTLKLKDVMFSSIEWGHLF